MGLLSAHGLLDPSEPNRSQLRAFLVLFRQTPPAMRQDRAKAWLTGGQLGRNRLVAQRDVENMTRAQPNPF